MLFSKDYRDKELLVSYFDADGNLLHTWKSDGTQANSLENIKEAVSSTGLVEDGQKIGVEISLNDVNILSTDALYDEFITL